MLYKLVLDTKQAPKYQQIIAHPKLQPTNNCQNKATRKLLFHFLVEYLASPAKTRRRPGPPPGTTNSPIIVRKFTSEITHGNFWSNLKFTKKHTPGRPGNTREHPGAPALELLALAKLIVGILGANLIDCWN